MLRGTLDESESENLKDVVIGGGRVGNACTLSWVLPPGTPKWNIFICSSWCSFKCAARKKLLFEDIVEGIDQLPSCKSFMFAVYAF